MSKKFNNVDSVRRFTGSGMGDAVRAGVLGGKYEALGASNLQWKTFNVSDDSLTVSSVREVAANLPSAAKKIIGETAEVTQTETGLSPATI